MPQTWKQAASKSKVGDQNVKQMDGIETVPTTAPAGRISPNRMETRSDKIKALLGLHIANTEQS